MTSNNFDISRYPWAYSWHPPDPKTDPARYEPYRKNPKKRDQRTPSLAPVPALDRIKEKYGIQI